MNHRRVTKSNRPLKVVLAVMTCGKPGFGKPVGNVAEWIFENCKTKRIEHTSKYLERAADKCDFTKMSGRGATLHQDSKDAAVSSFLHE